jgi:hypothetical protein
MYVQGYLLNKCFLFLSMMVNIAAYGVKIETSNIVVTLKIAPVILCHKTLPSTLFIPSAN